DGRAMDGQGTRRAGGSGQPPADATAGATELGEALAGARAGDEFAFRLIFRTLQPGILRYVRGLVGEDAEDVASEAWAQVARDLAGFTGDADGFRRWVVTIARNRALDHLRRRRRRPSSSVAAA